MDQDLNLLGDADMLPLAEASGLGRRLNPHSGLAEILAVGDAAYTVITARPDDVTRLSAQIHEVAGQGPGRVNSQFEAVAGDGEGNVYVVREKGAKLLVVTPSFAVDRTIALDYEGAGDARHGLECLLLMRNGNIISAKQRDPLYIVELAPDGGVSRGFNSETFLRSYERFEVSNTVRMREVGRWQVELDGRLASINDMAVGRNGSLLVVSSSSRCVAHIADLPVGAEAVDVRQTWALPSEVFAGDANAKAEGLLVDAELGNYIVVDTKVPRADNVFSVHEF